MRTNKLNLVSSCIAAMLLAACGGDGGGSTNPSSAPAPIAALNSQARYQIVLKNAITGQRITDSLSVAFTGDAELKAADGSSLNGKTITTTDGLVALGATFNATAKDFSVLVGNRALGWVETGVRVLGSTTSTGDQVVELRLVNIKNAAAINASPVPISMVVGTGNASATGALTSSVVLATPSKLVTNAEGEAETTGTSTLNLATGTIGTTADGKPAAAGPLTVSVVNYSNANIDSLSAFPGGFGATVSGAPSSVLNGAAANDGAFITGGFAQFNVTDSKGNAIRKFDKPVSVSIDLPKTSLDADGVPVQAGAGYPVWSYDDATGAWKFEKTGTITEKSPVDPNNYTVAFSTDHLSSWNLDFYTPSCTAQINLTGRPQGDQRSLTIQVVGVKGQRFSSTGEITDSQLNLYRSPYKTRVNVKVLDQGVVVGQASNALLCAAPNQPKPISIPITLKPLTVGSIQVNTSESCPDGSQKRALPSFAFVNVNNSNKFRVGYTTPVPGDTVARKEFFSIPAGTSTVYALNLRKFSYEVQSVAVTANNTTTASFNFGLTCTRPTGATGATGAGG